MLLTGSFPGSHSCSCLASFLIWPRTICLGMTMPTVAWALLYQLRQSLTEMYWLIGLNSNNTFLWVIVYNITQPAPTVAYLLLKDYTYFSKGHTVVLACDALFCTVNGHIKIFPEVQVAVVFIYFYHFSSSLSSFLSFLLSLHVYFYFLLHIYLWTTRMPSIHRSQKKVMDILEWNYRWLLRCQVCAETKLGISTRTIRGLNHCSISQSLPDDCFQKQIWLVEGSEQELAGTMLEERQVRLADLS